MTSSTLQKLLPSDRNQRRALIVGLVLIAVGISLGGLDTDDSPQPTGTGTPLALPDRVQAPGITPDWVEPAATTTELEEQTLAPWDRVTIQRGQTLGGIFDERGYSPTTLHRILELDEHTAGLKRIRPGEEFAFQDADDGSMARMRYTIDDERYLVVESDGDALTTHIVERDIDTREFQAAGVIHSSFFLAGKEAGLSDAKIMDLANIFGWDIDFILDIREGDRFQVIYEKVYRDGEFLKDGEILAATFINQGDRFRAIRFETENGVEYFAPDGRNMKKAFLRAPLNFSYVSSNFNPKRMHPVLKRVRPHNGVDYRAPTGTPVYAAGAGRVTRSAYNAANGHHVFIEHAGSIVTKYLHFSKRAVKQGQRVRQGQVIGYVGSTGLSTAPHLHYEFLVGGVHRNPRTVPLPKVEPLVGDQLAAFQAQARPLLNQLSKLESASMFAAAE